MVLFPTAKSYVPVPPIPDVDATDVAETLTLLTELGTIAEYEFVVRKSWS